jgi:transposase
MTSKTKTKAATRRAHSPEFRAEALALAEQVGVSKAAKELGLHSSQLYGWRSKARVKQSQSDVEQKQAAEIARLKRQLADQTEELAIVKKAATYFARSLK